VAAAVVARSALARSTIASRPLCWAQRPGLGLAWI
jgi:hypothetical protein